MADKTLMEKINQGRQYRSTQAIEPVKAPDEEKKYNIRGYAATFNEPYVLYKAKEWEYREQIDPDAFREADMSDVILQFDHEGMVYARTSNGTLTLGTDEHGLLINADLGSTATTREIFEQIQKRLITKMSFGFTVAEDEELRTTDEDGREIWLRTIKKIGKLYDVSVVSMPANDGTEVSARSLVDGVIARRAQEIEQQQADEAAAEKAKAEADAKEKEQRERERLRALTLMNMGD